MCTVLRTYYEKNRGSFIRGSDNMPSKASKSVVIQKMLPCQNYLLELISNTIELTRAEIPLSNILSSVYGST